MSRARWDHDPQSWLNDDALMSSDLDTQGAWMKILCVAWLAPDRGVLERTLPEWSNLLGCPEAQASKIIGDIERLKIADVERNGHGRVKIVSRHMVSEQKAREAARERQRRKRAQESHAAPSAAPDKVPAPAATGRSRRLDPETEKLVVDAVQEAKAILHKRFGVRFLKTGDAKRAEKIRTRIRAGFTVEQCVDGVRGICLDDWDGRDRYCEPGSYVWRSNEQLTKWLERLLEESDGGRESEADKRERHERQSKDSAERIAQAMIKRAGGDLGKAKRLVEEELGGYSDKRRGEINEIIERLSR